MKKYIKKTGAYCIIFTALIVIYIMGLTITSLVPRELIEKQVEESAETLVQEGNHYTKDFGIRQILLDNYTTALMINNAYSIDTKEPLKSSLLARKNYLPGITKTIYETSSHELVGASQYGIFDGVKELKGTVDKEVTESYEYARYWHGYLVILRPVLILLNVQQIRTVSTVLIITISAYLLYQIYKKIDKKTMIAFLIGLIICEIPILGIELQGQLNIYIMLIASITLLKTYKKNKKYNISLFMFIVGSITNFFDFFTTPLLTYAIPLMIFYLLETKKDKKNIKEVIKIIFKTGIAWVAGYILTWITKWVIVDILYHKNIIANAIEQIRYRGLDKEYKYLTTVWQNLQELGIINLSIIVYLSLYNIGIIGYHLIKKDINTNTIFYIIVLLIPFAWYFVVRQHSHQHSAFTYRILYITIICQIFIFLENLRKKPTSIDKKQ